MNRNYKVSLFCSYCKDVNLIESLVILMAFISFLLCGLSDEFKSWAVAETLTTLSTLIRLLSCGILWWIWRFELWLKPFPTVITFIGFFSRMDSLMNEKMWTLTETFTTLFTFIGFLSSMHPFDECEVLNSCWSLPTFMTNIGFLPVWTLWWMRRSELWLKSFPQVSHLYGFFLYALSDGFEDLSAGKALTTVTTFIGLFSCVTNWWPEDLSSDWSLYHTHHTLIWFLSGVDSLMNMKYWTPTKTLTTIDHT